MVATSCLSGAAPHASRNNTIADLVLFIRSPDLLLQQSVEKQTSLATGPATFARCQLLPENTKAVCFDLLSPQSRTNDLAEAVV